MFDRYEIEIGGEVFVVSVHFQEKLADRPFSLEDVIQVIAAANVKYNDEESVLIYTGIYQYENRTEMGSVVFVADLLPKVIKTAFPVPTGRLRKYQQ